MLILRIISLGLNLIFGVDITMELKRRGYKIKSFQFSSLIK